MKDKFLAFLKKHRAYRRWKNNMIANSRYYNTIDEYFKGDHTSNNYISIAFVWSDTKEGFYYWAKISNKWRKILNENKKD